MKEKYARANNAPFTNKVLSKAVMTRSRLRNRYLKEKKKSSIKNIGTIVFDFSKGKEKVL